MRALIEIGVISGHVPRFVVMALVVPDLTLVVGTKIKGGLLSRLTIV